MQYSGRSEAVGNGSRPCPRSVSQGGAYGAPHRLPLSLSLDSAPCSVVAHQRPTRLVIGSTIISKIQHTAGEFYGDEFRSN
jgi:hypothetical protein